MLNIEYKQNGTQKEAVVILNKENINGFEARQFVEEVVNKINKDIDLLLIDMAKVVFISSAGLGMIVNSHIVLKKHNIPIKIVNVSEEVRKLFAMTKIDSIIEVSRST